MALLQSVLGSVSVRGALAFFLSLGLLVGQIFALVVFLKRVGLMTENPFEANSWHGRGVSSGDAPDGGPRFGFVVFLLGLVGCLVVTVTVLDWLLGL